MNLLVVGDGGHARSCIDVVEQHGVYVIAGLVVKSETGLSKSCGYKILGTDDQLQNLVAQYPNALIGLGQIKTPDARIKMYDTLKDFGYHLPTIISPRAYVSPQAKVGEGVIIMPGAVVNAGAQIGDNCVINTNAVIEHDSTVGMHCHISTGVLVNGSVQVGQGTFLGSGVIVMQGLSVGAYCVVGMGQSIRQSLTDNTQWPYK